MLSLSDFNCIFSEIQKTSEKLINQNISHDELKINISTSAISVVKQEPNNT